MIIREKTLDEQAKILLVSILNELHHVSILFFVNSQFSFSIVSTLQRITQSFPFPSLFPLFSLLSLFGTYIRPTYTASQEATAWLQSTRLVATASQNVDSSTNKTDIQLAPHLRHACIGITVLTASISPLHPTLPLCRATSCKTETAGPVITDHHTWPPRSCQLTPTLLAFASRTATLPAPTHQPRLLATPSTTTDWTALGLQQKVVWQPFPLSFPKTRPPGRPRRRSPNPQT